MKPDRMNEHMVKEIHDVIDCDTIEFMLSSAIYKESDKTKGLKKIYDLKDTDEVVTFLVFVENAVGALSLEECINIFDIKEDDLKSRINAAEQNGDLRKPSSPFAQQHTQLYQLVEQPDVKSGSFSNMLTNFFDQNREVKLTKLMVPYMNIIKKKEAEKPYGDHKKSLFLMSILEELGGDQNVEKFLLKLHKNSPQKDEDGSNGIFVILLIAGIGATLLGIKLWVTSSDEQQQKEIKAAPKRKKKIAK